MKHFVDIIISYSELYHHEVEINAAIKMQKKTKKLSRLKGKKCI